MHSPIRPEGVWRWVLVGSIAGAFLLFLLGLWLVRRSGAPLAAVVAIAAAIQLAPLAVPLLLSTDAYGYWESGWIAAVADKSPYDHPPGEFLENPANAHRGAAWNDYPTWYGPVFVAATEAQAKHVDTRAGVVRLYKLLAAIAMLAVVGLTAYCARRRAYAAAFVGCNPLLALHFAGGGHNDVWMIALFLGSLAAWTSGRRQIAGVLWVLSIAIKWVPLMWVPLDVLANRKTGARPPWLGLAIGLGAVSVMATWLFGLSWLDSFVPIGDQLGLSSSTSIPFHVASLLDVPAALGRPRHSSCSSLAAYCALLRPGVARPIAEGHSPRRSCSARSPGSGRGTSSRVMPLAVIEEDGPAEVLSLGLTAFLLRDVLPIPWIF